MSIISFNVQTPMLQGIAPRTVQMVSTDNLATITAAGYMNKQGQVLQGENLSPTDVINVIYSFNTATNSGTFGIFTVSFSGAVITLNQWNESASGPVTFTTSTASATPGTIRSLVGQMTSTATVMTSGNLVGARGAVNYVGASGGFIYGVQGKVIPTGTLSGSEWSAGIFGQVDISAATINAGQIAPIWGDYGATSGTLTNETGMYGIAMTNTTAAVLAGQLYLYGGATQLMLLNTNAGLSGTTYFLAAGTSAGSAGDTSKCNATEVLKISVNGTQYYIPLFAQNT